MSTSTTSQIPPGWYPNQTEPGQERWWDGDTWTSDVRAARQSPDVPAPGSWMSSPPQAPVSVGMSAMTPYSGAPTGIAMHGTGFAVTSMILGILALVFSFIPFVNALTFPLAVVALPLGGIAMTKKYQGHGMAITCVVTAVLSVVIVIAMIASLSS